MQVMGGVSPANETEVFSLQEEGVATPVSPPLHPASGLSYTGGNRSGPQPLPAPPPPPPPPPPAPPPPPPIPPLLPGLGDPAVGLRKKRRVRSFFWKTIPEDQVKGRSNLWTQGQQYQIDVSTIEELFSQRDCQSNVKATPTRGGVSRGSFREVSILDFKRGMNIGIFLKQFRRTNQAIVDDIYHGNSQPYGAEPLRELLKLLPESEEVRRLKSYHGDVSELSLADSFMYQLIQLPSYSIRIESMLLKEEFPALSDAMRRDVTILRTAAKELLSCEELHAVLHLVLQAGNILNAGGYAGNAVGFKLSSLLSLADTKANKPGMNLLHFVALETQKKDAQLLEFLVKLSHVAPAARISVDTLDADLQLLTSRTRSVQENVQEDTQLLQQLDDFLQSATSCLRSLHGIRQNLKEEGGKLIDFFCEDHETFRLDDCFSIFNSFCCRFAAAVKENVERDAKEAARRRRIQHLEEQKRHSWAGGEKVGGAFGWRCSSETDISAVVSQHDKAALLMELLTPMSRPFGRSRSLRRSRNSPSSSSSVAAEQELSVFLGIATPDPPTGSDTPKNHTTATNLSFSVVQSHDTKGVKATSNSNQQSDHNKNGSNLLNRFETNRTSLHQQAQSGLSGDLARMKNHEVNGHVGVEVLEREAVSGVSVVLQRHTLVPELRGFDDVINASRLCGFHQDDTVITDLKEETGDATRDPRNSQIQDEEQSSVQISSSRIEEEEGHEEKVIVWCVTSVCEVAGDFTDPKNEGTEKDQLRKDNPEGTTSSCSAADNHSTSEPQPANENPVPEPISCQPVPVLSHISSPRWHPAEATHATEKPTCTTRVSEEAKETSSQKEDTESSTNQKRATVTKQSSDRSSDHSASCPTASKTTEGASAVRNGRSVNSSKPSAKNCPTSKTRPAGMKPSTPNTDNKSRPVRTLTTSENQGMRRVVPISRTSRGATSLGKNLQKPAGNQTSAGLPASNLHSTSPQRGDSPLTTYSSRRSSINKDRKDSKDQKISGTQEQSQDSKKKHSNRKALTKPKVQQEEKMCRSTLRALQGGTGGSVSAPTTPLHKVTSSSLLPSFARSTAASSFRHTTLAPPTSSPKTTTSSNSAFGTSSPLRRSGSLRTRRSSDLHSPSSSSSPLSRSQSIRAPPRSSLTDSLVPPKGHQLNNSSTFSDKSAHRRDSGKSTRPSWR